MSAGDVDAIVPEVPETETDDASAPGKPLTGAKVALNPYDATLDAFVSEAGLLSSLSQGSFRHLLSGMRADAGAKGGRYLFEVQAIEHGPRESSELRVGLSAGGSSLFLGDGSAENVCFDWNGTYHFAEPGFATSRQVPKACQPLGRRVVGLLVNLDDGSPNANTVSVFLDGRRAGKPQPIPSHLRGRALFPAVTFKNLTLAVNFGAEGQLMRSLPFACKTFACLDAKHAERSALGAPKPQQQVVVPVGLPDEGIFDFVEKFLHEHPDFTELSDRMLEQWCVKSGLKKTSTPGPLHSRDRPDFSFGLANIDGRTWRTMLRMLAQLSQRNLLCVQVEWNLHREEREQFLSLFPKSVKKVAAVAVGEPSKPFKDWVHSHIRAKWETRRDEVERRRSMAEAAGEDVAESDLQVPAEPVIDSSVIFLPCEGSVPDMSEKAIACSLANACVPSSAEGFDEVRYDWLAAKEANAHFSKWVSSQKASLIVEGLVPGSWFVQGLEEWHALRSKLRTKHQEYAEKRKRAMADGIDLDDAALDFLDLSVVTDVHNADGNGTPLYGHFKYEDWIILAWRIELHLLVHAFLRDADDAERTGIPEAHVAHYFQVYYKMKLDPRKVAADGLPQTLKVLKGSMELAHHKSGKMLRSKLEADVPWEDFVKDVEKYRRDRMRRIDAGDESANITFPRAAPKAGAKGAGKGAAKATVTVPVKRPAPAGTTEPTAKKPRPEGQSPTVKVSIAKAPVTKAPVAKSPVAKAPVAKALVAKAPVAKAPVAKAPVAKAPVVKVSVAKAPVAKRKA